MLTGEAVAGISNELGVAVAFCDVIVEILDGFSHPHTKDKKSGEPYNRRSQKALQSA